MLLFLTLFCSGVSKEWRAVLVSDHLSQLKVRLMVIHSSLRGRVCLLRGSLALEQTGPRGGALARQGANGREV